MLAPLAPGRAARDRRHEVEARRRRLAVLAAVGIVVVTTLLVTAFGGGDHPAGPVPVPAMAARLLPAGPPAVKPIARLGLSLTLNVPVNETRLTAIGYFGAADGALSLTPIGTQANQGVLERLVHTIVGGGSGGGRWYLLPGGDGPSTSALDVGAAPGTDVYSPVSGTIVGIGKLVLDGKTYGQRIDIQPVLAPSLVVSVSDLTADRSLAVGTTVTASKSRLGVVEDLSKVQTQALARYTNDAGNHVLIEVHPAATLGVR